MLLPLLGSSLVGGLIGYGTNWLAVRMLFWPQEEKRLWGWRVPFTPGLIPKKRGRLARALGETVAEHLLTAAALNATLAGPKFAQDTKDALLQFWQHCEYEQATLGQWLQQIGLPAIVEQSVEAVADGFVSALQHHGFRKLLGQRGTRTLGTLIWTFWQTLIASPPLHGEAGNDPLVGIMTQGRDLALLIGQRLVPLLSHLRQSSVPIGTLLPEGSREVLRDCLLQHAPDLLDFLQTALRLQKSKALLKRLLQQTLNTSTVLKLAGAFINLDRVVDSIPMLLVKEEVRAEIVLQLLNSLDQLWEIPVSRVLGSVCPDKPVLPWLKRWVNAIFTPQQIDTIAQRLRRVDWQSFRLDSNTNWQPFLGVIADALDDTLADHKVAEELRHVVKQMLLSMLEIPVKELFSRLDLHRLPQLSDQVVLWLIETVSKRGEAILRALPLSEMVESQVNSLDIDQVEEILLRVMREQLRAITNLGFVLGAVVGLALPFLNAWLANL